VNNEQVIMLINALIHNTVITSLTFICRVPIKPIVNLLTMENCSLIELRISDNYWDKINVEALATDVEILANALLVNKSIVKLDLYSSALTDSMGKIIANMLLTNNTVTSLNLSSSKLNQDTLDLLQSGLEKNKLIARKNQADKWIRLFNEHSMMEQEGSSPELCSLYHAWRRKEFVSHRNFNRGSVGELLDKLTKIPTVLQERVASFITGEIPNNKSAILADSVV
jgi:hypothetical protein